MSTEITSSNKEEVQEVIIWSRVVRPTEEGMEMEAAVRHADIIAAEWRVARNRAVVTPGVDHEGSGGTTKAMPT